MAVIGAVALMRGVELKHFTPDEFGGWFEKIDPELLLLLDQFREQWGAPVIISGAVGGVGREDASHSQHNVNEWGQVRAVDVFPMVAVGDDYEYITSAEDRQRAYELARAVGFTGIGLYTDTSPGDMLHLDVRRARVKGQPATWARISGEYTGIGAVLA